MKQQHATPKTIGQLAYEEDCRRQPTYYDGTPRRPWSRLGDVERLSWERCPAVPEWLAVVVGGDDKRATI